MQRLHKNVAACPRGSYSDRMFIYRDFWDAFEEDEVDDDVFAEHEIFWSPRDLLVTSLQISAAAVLLLITLLVLTLIQMSLIMLSRTSTNPQVREAACIVFNCYGCTKILKIVEFISPGIHCLDLAIH